MNRDLIRGYNYQKNLKISDPGSSKNIGDVKLEIDFFENFISITLINIYWQVHDTTAELQFQFIDPILGKQLGFEVEYKKKTQKIPFKKRGGIDIF